ncbi:MAG: hypothetical protein V1712_02900 [Patescibacteria group bacterium]
MAEYSKPEENYLKHRELEKKPADFRVAIFGTSSEQNETDLQAMEYAKKLAEQIIESGFSISTGGYDKGVMKATTDSAYEAAKKIGIDDTKKLIKAFPLTENINAGNKVRGAEINESSTLIERLKHLIDESKAFIVLGGKLGTIVELITAIHSENIQQMQTDKPASRPTIIIDPELEHLNTINQLFGNDERLSKMDGLKHTYILGKMDNWLDRANKILYLYYRQNNGEELNIEDQEFLDQSNYLENFNHWLINTVKNKRNAGDWPPGRGL